MGARPAWLGPAGERADELASSHLPDPAAGLGFLKTESGTRQLTPDCVFTDFTRLWGQLWPPHPCGLMVGDVGPDWSYGSSGIPTLLSPHGFSK